MTLSEYRHRIQATIYELDSIGETIAVKLGMSGLAVVKNRSINDGLFVSGVEGRYADYSVNKILTVKLIGSELNQAGRDFIKKNRLATYHDYRIAQGLDSTHVNANYSGRFWASLAITGKDRLTAGKIQVIVGSIDSEVLEYAPDLFKRYGQFTRPTRTEEKELALDAINELTAFLKTKL